MADFSQQLLEKHKSSDTPDFGDKMLSTFRKRQGGSTAGRAKSILTHEPTGMEKQIGYFGSATVSAGAGLAKLPGAAFETYDSAFRKLTGVNENNIYYSAGKEMLHALNPRVLTDKWAAGIESINTNNPDWAYQSPEKFTDLASSPEALLGGVVSNAPQLIAGGVSMAMGAPSVGATIIFGLERQEAVQRALASGATDEEALWAGNIYGTVSTAIEMLQVKQGMRLLGINRTGVKNLGVRNLTRALADNGGKFLPMMGQTAVKEALEEMAQGTWGDVTQKIVMDEDVFKDGIWKFVDDRAKEGLLALTTTLATGGVGGAGRVINKIKGGTSVRQSIVNDIMNSSNLTKEQAGAVIDASIQDVTDIYGNSTAPSSGVADAFGKKVSEHIAVGEYANVETGAARHTGTSAGVTMDDFVARYEKMGATVEQTSPDQFVVQFPGDKTVAFNIHDEGIELSEEEQAEIGIDEVAAGRTTRGSVFEVTNMETGDTMKVDAIVDLDGFEADRSTLSHEVYHFAETLMTEEELTTIQKTRKGEQGVAEDPAYYFESRQREGKAGKAWQKLKDIYDGLKAGILRTTNPVAVEKSVESGDIFTRTDSSQRSPSDTALARTAESTQQQVKARKAKIDLGKTDPLVTVDMDEAGEFGHFDQTDRRIKGRPSETGTTDVFNQREVEDRPPAEQMPAKTYMAIEDRVMENHGLSRDAAGYALRKVFDAADKTFGRDWSDIYNKSAQWYKEHPAASKRAKNIRAWLSNAIANQAGKDAHQREKSAFAPKPADKQRAFASPHARVQGERTGVAWATPRDIRKWYRSTGLNRLGQVSRLTERTWEKMNDEFGKGWEQTTDPYSVEIKRLRQIINETSDKALSGQDVQDFNKLTLDEQYEARQRGDVVDRDFMKVNEFGDELVTEKNKELDPARITNPQFEVEYAEQLKEELPSLPPQVQKKFDKAFQIHPKKGFNNNLSKAQSDFLESRGFATAVAFTRGQHFVGDDNFETHLKAAADAVTFRSPKTGLEQRLASLVNRVFGDKLVLYSLNRETLADDNPFKTTARVGARGAVLSGTDGTIAMAGGMGLVFLSDETSKGDVSQAEILQSITIHEITHRLEHIDKHGYDNLVEMLRLMDNRFDYLYQNAKQNNTLGELLPNYIMHNANNTKFWRNIIERSPVTTNPVAFIGHAAEGTSRMIDEIHGKFRQFDRVIDSGSLNRPEITVAAHRAEANVYGAVDNLLRIRAAIAKAFITGATKAEILHKEADTYESRAEFNADNNLAANNKGDLNFTPNPSQPFFQKKQISTPQFKEWFRNSKIVDRQGNPLVVYHGTKTANFDEFDPATWEQGIERYGDMGFHFTYDPDHAEDYTFNDELEQPPGSAIKPVYLSIQNPKHIMQHPSLFNKSPEFLKALEAEGYDGVIVGEEAVGSYEMVVFESSQIKSAISNKGTFDSSSPNINFQKKTMDPAAWKRRVKPHLDKILQQAGYGNFADSEMILGRELLDSFYGELELYRQEINNSLHSVQKALANAIGRKRYSLTDTFDYTKLNGDKSSVTMKDVSTAMMVYIDMQNYPDSFSKFYNKLNLTKRGLVDLAERIKTDPQFSKFKKVADDIVKIQDKFANQFKSDSWFKDLPQYKSYIHRAWDFGTKSKKPAFKTFGLNPPVTKLRQFEEGGILEGWSYGKNLKTDDVTTSMKIGMDQLALSGRAHLLMDALETNNMITDDITEAGSRGFKPINHPAIVKWNKKGKLKDAHADVKVGVDKATGKPKHVSGQIERSFEIDGEWYVRVKYDQPYGNRKSGLHRPSDINPDSLGIGRAFISPTGQLYVANTLYAAPVIANNLNNSFRRSKLQGMPVVDFLTQFNAITKNILLLTSFFHQQAYYRSFWLGGSVPIFFDKNTPFSKRGWNLREMQRQGMEAIRKLTPEARNLIRAGMTVGRVADFDPSASDKWLLEKANSGNMVWKKLYNIKRQYEQYLFGYVGPALKMQAGIIEARKRVEANRAKLESGEMTLEEIYGEVANLMNNDFGGLNREREGANPTAVHVQRLAFLGPDWTISNFRSMYQSLAAGERGKVHRLFWARIIGKGVAATIAFNLLMAGFDDDDDRFKKAWDAGNLKWLDVDVTPIYKALGGKKDIRKYFSIIGHFKDPAKWIMKPGASFSHKASVSTRFAINAMKGTDYAHRRFTSFGELMGISGDPQAANKIVSWNSKNKSGPINIGQIPAFAIDSTKGMIPIQIQQLVGLLTGEIDAFDALTHASGMSTSTTYEKQWQKKRRTMTKKRAFRSK